MRLDKFLKVSRIIKRRPLAKEVADQGRVKINGHVAKASSQVAIDDEIVIQFGQKIVTIRVTDLKDTTRKEDAATLYTVLKEEQISKEN